MKTALIAIGCIGVIALAVAWEVSIWHECRATNSFLYCVRVLGH